MSEHTHELDLEAERERLDHRLEKASDEAAKYDRDSPQFDKAVKQGQQLDQQMLGLLHLQDAYDDPRIVIREVRQQEYADVGDRVSDLSEEMIGRQSVDNASKGYLVAQGLVEAPFISEDDTFEQRVEAVGDQYPQVVKYLAAKINEVSTPDVDFPNRFAERYQAKRNTSTSE